MRRIHNLYKPQQLETLSCLVDSQRILQTLVNTQYYEAKTNQFDMKALKENNNGINQNEVLAQST